MDVREAKAQTRRLVEGHIEALGAQGRATESAALTARLVRFLEEGPWTWVLATLPLSQEPDVTGALTGWLARGKRLALARTGPNRTLDFLEVTSLDGPWEPRPYGLREPPRTCPAWVPGEPTLCLVPGLGFAPASPGFGRLGRGAGYYDRWLGAHGASVFALGWGFSVQRLDEVPVEVHDRRLDGWLGPEGIESGS
jgi:5-formyltetrahydrofolate cyclo-ligase